jgi:hypothetical protein
MIVGRQSHTKHRMLGAQSVQAFQFLESFSLILFYVGLQ